MWLGVGLEQLRVQLRKYVTNAASLVCELHREKVFEEGEEVWSYFGLKVRHVGESKKKAR